MGYRIETNNGAFFVHVDGRGLEMPGFPTRTKARAHLRKLQRVFRQYEHCLVCGKEHTETMKAWARKCMERKTCSPACNLADIKRRFACCEQAEPLPCVCMYSFRCPVHGDRHIGTHD